MMMMSFALQVGILELPRSSLLFYIPHSRPRR
jgi:hypothetical protein